MRADALARRKRIIAAARDVIATNPAVVSLEEIAKRAGVGIATLYRNFPDRTSLFGTIVEELFGQIVELQTATLHDIDALPEQAWLGYANGLINLGLAPLASTFTAEMAMNFHPDIVKLRDELARRNSLIVEKAQAAGLVSPAVDGPFFMRGLLSVARPQHRSVLDLDEGFMEQLVNTYLVGLKHYE